MTLTLAGVTTTGRTRAFFAPPGGRLAHARRSQPSIIPLPGQIAPFSEQPPITITILPRTVSLEIYEGDDIFIDLEITNTADDSPADLASAVAKSQIRLTPSEENIEAEFNCQITDNVIKLHLPNSQNVNMPDAAVWDCQITQAGTITTLAAGTVDVTHEVTRP